MSCLPTAFTNCHFWDSVIVMPLNDQVTMTTIVVVMVVMVHTDVSGSLEPVRGILLLTTMVVVMQVMMMHGG